MALIDVTKLKQDLRIYNVTADLSDEDLELLLNNTISRFQVLQLDLKH